MQRFVEKQITSFNNTAESTLSYTKSTCVNRSNYYS